MHFTCYNSLGIVSRYQTEDIWRHYYISNVGKNLKPATPMVIFGLNSISRTMKHFQGELFFLDQTDDRLQKTYLKLQRSKKRPSIRSQIKGTL